MKVKITSPCMAMLVYEAAKSEGQTEGCIQGEIATEITKNITDSDVSTVTENVLFVHSICPLHLSSSTSENHSFEERKIFGWFKFCRRPLLRLSVREKSIHRKLARKLSETETSTPLVSILMHERWSENHFTYLWKFAAFYQQDRRFLPCKVEVINLKASTCGAYKPYPSVNQRQRLPQVTRVLTSLRNSFSSTSSSSFNMVGTVRNAGIGIVRSLHETAAKLHSMEMELKCSYDEQEKLRKSLLELQNLRKDEADGDSSRSSDRVYYLNESDETDTSDSSESGEYYGIEKTNELLEDLKGMSNIVQKSSTGSPEEVHTNNSLPENAHAPIDQGVAAVVNADNDPPPPYDPFDSLVDLAKAGLKKAEVVDRPSCSRNEMELLAEYNDERPWREKTRAGRQKNDKK